MIFGRKSNEHRRHNSCSDSLSGNSALLSKLNGRHIKYVSLRRGMETSETVIGKDGVINIIDNVEMAILCNTKTVFRHRLDELKADELMSLAGVNLRYKDIGTGDDISIIAYYRYHRK